MPCYIGSHVDSSQKMQGQKIAPEHAKWRVGPDGIQAKDLCLAALEQVSVGSWQPRLFYKPETSGKISPATRSYGTLREPNRAMDQLSHPELISSALPMPVLEEFP